MFKLRSLKENICAAVDLTVVLMVGIAFAGLMVMGYVIWTLYDQLLPQGAPSATTTAMYNDTYRSVANVTTGFDNAINFLLIAITIFILSIAIAALLMLRGRSQ
jgi:large-conductance mechanosensitive channel